MQLTWTELKSLVVQKNLSVQYVTVGSNYWLKAIDGAFQVETLIPLDPTNDDTIDFEANYKPNGNRAQNALVTTQYEKNDKDLKIACGSASVDATTGLATVTVPVPGDISAGNGRYIAGGTAFFDTAHSGDMVIAIQVVDIDNVLGAGAGYVLKSYVDTEQASENQGWFIPIRRGQIEVEPIGGYGFIPSQLYIQITAKKSAGNYAGTFYMNLFWGRKE